MKYIIGTIVTALILCVAAYFTLDLWEIENPITLDQLQKGLKTAMLVSGTSVFLLIVISFFFKNDSKGYDKDRGNVAKPKSNQ